MPLETEVNNPAFWRVSDRFRDIPPEVRKTTRHVGRVWVEGAKKKTTRDLTTIAGHMNNAVMREVFGGDVMFRSWIANR